MRLANASEERLARMLDTLDTFNDDPSNGTTRILFTPCELEAREYIKSEMRKLQLEVREDAIGNIFGSLKGRNPELAPVWTGSHIDTVPHAGKYDGMTGVVAGLEAIRLIQEAGLVPLRTIEVVVYTSEEPTRFGMGCLGSRALAGELTLGAAAELVDEHGDSLSDVLAKLGYDLETFAQIPVKPKAVWSAVELHIEQGAVLESLGLPIGLVHTICAPTSLEVTITGEQRHAGSTPMSLRKDAFAACCEIALELERLACQSPSVDTVGTVGKVEVLPNASNVISGHVHFSIDIRDSSYEVKEAVVQKLLAYMEEVKLRRGVGLTVKQLNNDRPMPCDRRIVAVLEEVCKAQHIPYHSMVSGAFHDSMMVGQFAPVAMLFVPSKDGISHSPDEYSSISDIAVGTQVLAETLVRLAEQQTR